MFSWNSDRCFEDVLKANGLLKNSFWWLFFVKSCLLFPQIFTSMTENLIQLENIDNINLDFQLSDQMVDEKQ